MKDLGRGINYKNDTIKPSTSYLGAQQKKKKLLNGNHCSSLSSNKYANFVTSSVDNVIKKKGRRNSNEVKVSMTSDFVSEEWMVPQNKIKMVLPFLKN